MRDASGEDDFAMHPAGEVIVFLAAIAEHDLICQEEVPALCILEPKFIGKIGKCLVIRLHRELDMEDILIPMVDASEHLEGNIALLPGNAFVAVPDCKGSLVPEERVLLGPALRIFSSKDKLSQLLSHVGQIDLNSLLRGCHGHDKHGTLDTGRSRNHACRELIALAGMGCGIKLLRCPCTLKMDEYLAIAACDLAKLQIHEGSCLWPPIRFQSDDGTAQRLFAQLSALAIKTVPPRGT